MSEKEKKIKGIILGIEEKSGVKNGKEWKIFNVIIGDIKISTFNEIMVDGYKTGDEVVIEYTEKASGQFTNRTMTRIDDSAKAEEADRLYEKHKMPFPSTDKEMFIIIDGKKYKMNCELVL